MIDALALTAALTLAGPAPEAHVPPLPVKHSAARIPARWTRFAACVSHRESHGSYTASSTISTSQGRWQFLDSQWRRGLAFMVADRLKAHGATRAQARHARKVLQRTAIRHWPAWAQDAGFAAVVTARVDGWRHWYLAGSACNALAVSR